MTVFLIIVSIIIILLWFMLRPSRGNAAVRAAFYGRNIAHRGLHTRNKAVPENSLAAFAAAADAGYGIELDIQLSRDGEVVVFHDDTLARVCGVNGRVDAFTLAELRAMCLCGTDQHIPLFSEVLQLVDGRVPLIVELKMGPHNKELCEKGLALLRAYKGTYCIESFHPMIVAWFRKNAPDIYRGQLSDAPSAFKNENQPWLTRFALGTLLTNVVARPQFIAYGPHKAPFTVALVHTMGAAPICWTVRDTDDIATKQDENDTVIFEYYTPEIKYK